MSAGVVAVPLAFGIAFVAGAAVLRVRDKMARERSVPTGAAVANATTRLVRSLLVFSIIGLLSACGVVILIAFRDTIFDDAFILYRYARHLGFGHGLVWNLDEAPVEGYTSFLMVVLLAPFVRAGLDPLIVSRALGIASVAVIGILTGVMARRTFGATRSAAWLCGAAAATAGRAFEITTLGMETPVYALALFLAYWLAVATGRDGGDARSDAALDARRWWRRSVGCGAMLFAAFLLRPEAALLGPVLCALAITRHPRYLNGGSHNTARAIVDGVLAVGLAFLLPTLLYAGWKLLFFGSLLPNAFLIKMGDASFPSQLGLASVLGYLQGARRLVLLAAVGLFWPGRAHAERVAAAGFVAATAFFFLGVDTLMDASGRFLYPVTPFLAVLAISPLRAGLEWLWADGRWAVSRALLAAALFLAAVSPLGPGAAWHFARTALSSDSAPPRLVFMEKIVLVAHRLAAYDGIRDLTIAYGDAGVIPYFTDARIVDTVGLNDNVIARERDLGRLVQYVFDRQPDIIVFPTLPDFTPPTFGHGPLGNWPAWIHRPECRWDRYTYAGTTTTDFYYLNFLVRREAPDADRLVAFVTEQVADLRAPEMEALLADLVRRRRAQ